jgi:hypothetical protein
MTKSFTFQCILNPYGIIDLASSQIHTMIGTGVFNGMVWADSNTTTASDRRGDDSCSKEALI